jgi:AmpD protein
MDPMVRACCSPNQDDRQPGDVPSLVIVHSISLPPDEFHGTGVESLFTNRLDPDEHPYYATIAGLRVSAHYFVRRDGTSIRFVEPEKRAWHAGVSRWRGREACNDFSIGIELEGSDSVPFEPAQYEVLAELIKDLRRRFPIEDVVGHCHVAPGRKTDPGPFFDWAHLRTLLADCAGLAVGSSASQPADGTAGRTSGST